MNMNSTGTSELLKSSKRRLLSKCLPPLAAMGLCACATVSSTKKVSQLPPEPPTVKDEQETGSTEPEVPAAMWSPAQREAAASYYYLAGEFAQLDGEAQRAHSFFENAYNLDPDPFLGGKMLGTSLEVKNISEVVEDAHKMVLLYPKSGQLHRYYGMLLGRKGELRRASKELEKAVELEPRDEMAYFSLIELYQQLEMPESSLAAAKQLTKISPESALAWLTLAKIHLIREHRAQALQAASQAYGIQANNPEIMLIYALCLDFNKKSSEALRLYEKLYRSDAASDQLIIRMTGIYNEIGGLPKALNFLDEVIKEGGDAPFARPGLQIQRAIILWELKRYEESSAILEKLTTVLPDSDMVRYMAGLGQEKQQNFDKALGYYDSIHSGSPFYFHALFRKAAMFRARKMWTEALAASSENLNASGEKAQWEDFALKAGIQSDMGNQNDAVNTVDEGLRIADDKGNLLFLKGVYLEKADRVPECIEVMRNVIRSDPKNSSAFNYLGYLYAERGRNLDEAEALVKEALRLKPGDPFYLDSLGWVYYQKKDFGKAEKFILESLEKLPTEGVVREHLGDVKLKKGQIDAARQEYENALKCELEAKDKLRIEEKLKSVIDRK